MSWKTKWGSFGGSNLRARSLASENRWTEDWMPEFRSARTPVLEFDW